MRNILKKYGFDKGLNSNNPVMYGHGITGPSEQDAHDVTRMDHTGWFTDAFQDGMAIGVICEVFKDQWLAGYRLTDNAERVYFPELFTDAQDAARMADEHARVIGESESEHNANWQAAQAIQTHTEELQKRLIECLALRHNACMDYIRAEIHETIEAIRSNRETLASDYPDFEV